MAVLNTHLSDLQESVKQLSPMFKDDKVVTLVQTAKKELDSLIEEAEQFENTVCTFFGVNNIEELRTEILEYLEYMQSEDFEDDMNSNLEEI